MVNLPGPLVLASVWPTRTRLPACIVMT